MKFDVHLGTHGFIIRNHVSGIWTGHRISEITGVLVDLPGPINPSLREISLGRGFLEIKTSLGSQRIAIPQRGIIFMKRWFNIVSQGILTAGQVFNVVAGFVPGKYQGLIAAILAAAQGVIGVVAHTFNPDGTPATAPYNPPK